MKRIKVRKDYVLISILVMVFALSSAFSLFKINIASVTLSDEYPLAVWTISQLETEHRELIHRLELYSVDEVSKDEVLEGFDILWNRTEVVLLGYESHFARQSLGANELVQRLLNTLKELDERVQALPEVGNKQVTGAVYAALVEFSEPLHVMNIRSFHERDTVYGLDALTDTLSAASAAFFGLVISGLLLVVMLVRQFRASHHIANHDAMTDLANRRFFMDQLDQLIPRAERYDQRFAVYLIDLDGFKSINDMHGHMFGDKVLKVFGRSLLHSLRKSDVAARLGGDEFAAIQYPVGSSREIPALSERLRKGLVDSIPSGSSTVSIKYSMGVAIYPEDGRNAEQLLHAADMQMYAEKTQSKRLSAVQAAPEASSV
ncbi:diguanylate cyclase domain-containing protein [Pontibacterium sp.]|uniref:GGDEF domain-containing protein n=1 Tax=Pontibacterium sp. TaxID=2036026 RepID=UPI00356A3570